MNRPKIILKVFVWFAAFSQLVNASEQLYDVAPTEIPHVSREMGTPGFWIARVPEPDKVLMGVDAIKTFNAHVRQELRLVQDLDAVPIEWDGGTLREELRSRVDGLAAKNYYQRNDQTTTPEYFEKIKARMALDQIKDKGEVRYGIIVRYADQRFLPTTDGLYAARGDIDFDELQNSALDIGIPVIILHRSANSQWLYVRSALSDGWVQSANVAECERADWITFQGNPTPIVVIAAKADIYLDEGLTQFHDYSRMGAVYPSVSHEGKQTYAIQLPARTSDGRLTIRTAFVERGQASQGYLPFTPRVILQQAFKVLHAPYGWGGMHGEQDCSRLLQEVYATVGIKLPRDSKNQAQVPTRLSTFGEESSLSDKVNALKTVTPGGIILPMRGHIMLYLGTVNNRPYAIHAFWAYREPTPDGDRIRVVNRTAVSDLYLGEGSKKGSLLQRLAGIIHLSHPDQNTHEKKEKPGSLKPSR